MATYQVESSALVAPDATLSAGVRIWHHAQVREGVTLGENVIIGKGAYIGPGAILTNVWQPRSINFDLTHIQAQQNEKPMNTPISA